MKHNKQLNISDILNSLSENFTDDAICLLQSYFDKLQNKLDTSGVPQTKRDFMIRGLYYFINEYIEDHISKNIIISFETTLEILNEIGSPTDIIQTLSFTKDSPMISTLKNNTSLSTNIPSSSTNIYVSESPKKVSQQIVCKYCTTSNRSSSNYCESCGRNLSYLQDFPQSLKQEIIDHSYFVTFLFCWFSLAIGNVFLYTSFGSSVLSLLFPNIHIRPWRLPIPVDLGLSIMLSFFPAILFTLILGFILDELFLNKMKSSKQKYNQAIENLHGRFFIGVWLTIIGIFIFVILIVNGFVEFILPLMFVLMIYASSFWRHILEGKPSNIPYFKLLSAKKLLDNNVKDRYFVYNPVSILLSVFLTVLWAFMSNSLYHPEVPIQEFILPGGLVLISFIIIFNGLFFLYFYNWPNIKKFLYRENDPTLNLNHGRY